MSIYEPNSRYLREILIFCFNMKKSAVEAHRMLSNTYGEAAISERSVMSGFNASRTVILTSKTGIAVEERRFSKNWRHYLRVTWVKTRVKIKKNWHDHWEWLNKHFKMPQSHWNVSEARKLGAVRIETEILNGIICLWIAAWKAKTEGISASHCDWGRKMGSLR